MNTITEEMIQDAIVYGVDEKDARRGYTISMSDYGNGATHIQKIDAMDVFRNDWAAAEQAERDGIKIIRDLVLPAEHNAPYIDTPANRLLLKPFVLKQINKDSQQSISQLMAGIKANTRSSIETLIKNSPDSEQIGLFIKDYSCYMTIQICDEGYDYTFYNREFDIIDGGQLDDLDISMAQAIYELLPDIDAQYATLELYDFEAIREREEINQKKNWIAKQSIGTY